MHRLILILLITSCSASQLIQMAKKKDPSMFADSVVVHDTIFREIVVPLHSETVIFDTDTIEIIKYVENVRDSLIVRIIKLPGDSIRIEAKCPDCPEITKTITIPPILLKPTVWQTFKKFGYVLLIAMLFGWGIGKIK